MISLLNHWILKKKIKGSYAGILLVDMISGPQISDEFIRHTTQALQLIERVDPRRFYYIQRELCYIINEPLLSGGAYCRIGRSCSIDFLRYRQYLEHTAPEYEWYLARYASVIVHEATHGRIHRFGIPYNRRTWERVERLCHLEQKRFVTHLHSENYDLSRLIGDFDPTWWRDDRKSSRFQQIKQLLARMREIEAADK